MVIQNNLFWLEYDPHDYYDHYRQNLFKDIINFRSTSRDLSCDQNLFDEEISILYNFVSILWFPVVSREKFEKWFLRTQFFYLRKLIFSNSEQKWSNFRSYVAEIKPVAIEINLNEPNSDIVMRSMTLQTSGFTH